MSMSSSLIDGALGVTGMALGAFGARQQNRWNREMVQRQQNFQERMSNTAYQRAMEI